MSSLLHKVILTASNVWKLLIHGHTCWLLKWLLLHHYRLVLLQGRVHTFISRWIPLWKIRMLFTLNRQQYLRWKKTSPNEHKKLKNETKRYVDGTAIHVPSSFRFVTLSRAVCCCFNINNCDCDEQLPAGHIPAVRRPTVG